MRFNYRRLLVMVGPLLAALGLACGGGEDATPTPQPRPAATATPTQVRQATAIPVPASPTPVVQATPTPAPAATATPRPAATATATTSRPTGKLVVAISTFGDESLDNRGSGSGFLDFATAYFDFLVWAHPDGTLAPGVIESWSMAPDGKMWTLKVRSNLRFHDNTLATAEDVKFSIEYNADPAARWAAAAAWRAQLDHLEVVSPTELRMITKLPAPLAMGEISPRNRGYAGIFFSKAAYERLGQRKYFFETPIGTGPWKLVRWETAQRFTYQPSGIAHPYREAAGFAEYQILSVPEETTRVAMARTGAAQVAEISPTSLDSAKRAGLDVLQVPATVIGSLLLPGFNNPDLFATKPTGNLKVRQALTYAIDRQEIVETVMQGFGETVARHAILPGNEGFDPAWKPDPFDPAKAKQLLAEGGFANGFEITLYRFPYGAAAWFPSAVDAIAGYWSAVGVRPRIVATELGTMARAWSRRPLQGDDIIGTAFMLPLFIRADTTSGLCAYYCESSSVNLRPERGALSDVVIKASSTLDEQERIRIIHEIVNRAYAEYLSIPIATSGSLYVGTGVEGWKPIRSLAGIGAIVESLRPKR
ncbi:MAG: ABC transporter substrate-binding protein [Chloroflexi bacterium]|nr:ABC transporter substrate-binding protein [Chloroflexota bacterium]